MTEVSEGRGEAMCDDCGHGFIWHFDFDAEYERYEPHGCEHFRGCPCAFWKEASK